MCSSDLPSSWAIGPMPSPMPNKEVLTIGYVKVGQLSPLQLVEEDLKKMNIGVKRAEFVRYAESLAMSQPTFDPLAQALAAAPTLVDDMLATLAIAASAVLYAREREWLDAANLLLWIAVVALLEIEVQRPAAVAAHPKAYARTAVVLYAALASLVVVWLINGKWMNAWDATVWLAAFGLLELNMLQQAENLFNKNR